MGFVRSHQVPVRAAVLGIGLAAALAGCTTAGKIWHQNRPILGDPTKGYGGGKDAPNARDPYPNLASVPARPKPTDPIADRRELQQQLVADRTASEALPKAPSAEPQQVAAAEPAPASRPSASAAPGPASATAASPVPNVQTAGNEPKKPGIWERFFGHKSKPAPDPNAIEPLPAQPTTPVTIKPADPAAPRS